MGHTPSFTSWLDFSRARNRHDGRNGPRPVRDHTFPWGFPWLRNADRDRVLRLTSSSSNASKLQNFKIRQAQCWLLVHPEDLGLTSSGLRPASIWQLPDVRSLVSERGFTFALHLCHFGAAAPTSTRVAGRLPAWNHFGVQWPVFDSGGKYLVRCSLVTCMPMQLLLVGTALLGALPPAFLQLSVSAGSCSHFCVAL